MDFEQFKMYLPGCINLIHSIEFFRDVSHEIEIQIWSSSQILAVLALQYRSDIQSWDKKGVFSASIINSKELSDSFFLRGKL